MVRPRIDAVLGYHCPSAGEVSARLTSGRAAQSTVRSWCNGTRRAPRWFLQVLDYELAEQVRERQELRELLAQLETGDRRRGALARARARAQIMAGIGAIGARKRAHGAANEDTRGENEPHN